MACSLECTEYQGFQFAGLPASLGTWSSEAIACNPGFTESGVAVCLLAVVFSLGTRASCVLQSKLKHVFATWPVTIHQEQNSCNNSLYWCVSVRVCECVLGEEWCTHMGHEVTQFVCQLIPLVCQLVHLRLQFLFLHLKFLEASGEGGVSWEGVTGEGVGVGGPSGEGISMGGTGGEGEGVSRDAGGRSWELAKQLVHLNTEPPMYGCGCGWVVRVGEGEGEDCSLLVHMYAVNDQYLCHCRVQVALDNTWSQEG